VLPSPHIGSSGNETAGANVPPGPHGHKAIQQVMNRRPSTSIPRKRFPDNLVGEGDEQRCETEQRP
jgi:hypothetical protein